MREHIRREAGQFVGSAWWLVPVAFATAAVAAVAWKSGDAGQSQPVLQSAVVVPVATPRPATMVPPATVKPQPEEPAVEVEHVQAF